MLSWAGFEGCRFPALAAACCCCCLLDLLDQLVQLGNHFIFLLPHARSGAFQFESAADFVHQARDLVQRIRFQRLDVGLHELRDRHVAARDLLLVLEQLRHEREALPLVGHAMVGDALVEQQARRDRPRRRWSVAATVRSPRRRNGAVPASGRTAVASGCAETAAVVRPAEPGKSGNAVTSDAVRQKSTSRCAFSSTRANVVAT